MPFYESVLIARQDISAGQVDTLADDMEKIITDNGGSVARREYCCDTSQSAWRSCVRSRRRWCMAKGIGIVLIVAVGKRKKVKRPKLLPVTRRQMNPPRARYLSKSNRKPPEKRRLPQKRRARNEQRTQR